VQRSRSKTHKTILETTVGDLIVVITDETHQQVRDEKSRMNSSRIFSRILQKNAAVLGHQQLAGNLHKS
jgi:hypothetical protein